MAFLNAVLTNSLRDALTLGHETLRSCTETWHMFVIWPLRVALQPERLFLIRYAGAWTNLRLIRCMLASARSRWTVLVRFHLVFPPVVRLDAVRNFRLHILRQGEECPGKLKLSINFVHSDVMINQAEEACGLGSFQQLLCDFFFSRVKVFNDIRSVGFPCTVLLQCSKYLVGR